MPRSAPPGLKNPAPSCILAHESLAVQRERRTAAAAANTPATAAAARLGAPTSATARRSRAQGSSARSRSARPAAAAPATAGEASDDDDGAGREEDATVADGGGGASAAEREQPADEDEPRPMRVRACPSQASHGEAFEPAVLPWLKAIRKKEKEPAEPASVLRIVRMRTCEMIAKAGLAAWEETFEFAGLLDCRLLATAVEGGMIKNRTCKVCPTAAAGAAPSGERRGGARWMYACYTRARPRPR